MLKQYPSVPDAVRRVRRPGDMAHLHLLRSASCDHAASDPISRITRWIGHIVIGGHVVNDCASHSRQKKYLSAAERNPIQEHFVAPSSVFLNVHVRQITCVGTGGVL